MAGRAQSGAGRPAHGTSLPFLNLRGDLALDLGLSGLWGVRLASLTSSLSMSVRCRACLTPPRIQPCSSSFPRLTSQTRNWELRADANLSG